MIVDGAGPMKPGSWLARQLERPRPYPVDRLAVAVGLHLSDPHLTSKLAITLGMNRGWVRRCRTLGLDEEQADRWACRAGIHPADVWPRFGELRGMAAVNAHKARCPKGHRYDAVDAHGRRRCSACRLVTLRRYRAKKLGKTQVTAAIAVDADDFVPDACCDGWECTGHQEAM